MAGQPAPNPELAELADILGEDKAREVVRTFLHSLPSAVHELTRGDRERAQRAAHGLKSSARQMGLLELSKRMAALEGRLRDPSAEISPAELAEVSKEFAAGAKALHAFAAG